jgi:hypothetical protein
MGASSEHCKTKRNKVQFAARIHPTFTTKQLTTNKGSDIGFDFKQRKKVYFKSFDKFVSKVLS